VEESMGRSYIRYRAKTVEVNHIDVAVWAYFAKNEILGLPDSPEWIRAMGEHLDVPTR